MDIDKAMFSLQCLHMNLSLPGIGHDYNGPGMM